MSNPIPNTPGWIDSYLLALLIQDEDGDPLPRQPALQLTGPGVSVTNDPTNGRTVATISGGSGITGVMNNGTPATSEPNINFLRQAVFDNPANHATAVLPIPLIQVAVGGTPITLDNTKTLAECATNSGLCSVALSTSGVFSGSQVTVMDIDGNCNVENVTITTDGGVLIENPASPGTFSSTVTIVVPYFTVVWGLSSSLGKWKVISRYPDNAF